MCTLTLSSGAPAGGTEVLLSSDNTLLPVPATSVTVPAGANSATVMLIAGSTSTPQSATLKAVALNAVLLNWTASVSPNLMFYKIYRGITSGGPYAPLATVGLVTSYVDYDIQASQTYYYVATAVDETGAESVYSNAASAALPSPTPQTAIITLSAGNPIQKAAGVVSLTSTANPASANSAVTFTARVPTGATGTITFAIDGVTLPPVSLSGGKAAFTISNLAVGNHTIMAAYSGDTNFSAGSSSLSQVITPPPPSVVTLTSSADPSTVGQPVTFTVLGVTVDGVTVTFYDGTVPLGSATVKGGVATLTTSALLAGSHSIVAQIASLNIQVTRGEVVNGIPTTIAVSAAPAAVVIGQSVVITAQVGPATAGVPAPSGQMAFQDNGNPVGTANVNAGLATLTLATLPAGTHQITAVYGGDQYWGSSFARVPVTVTQAALAISNSAAPLSSSFAPDEVVSIFHVPGLSGDATAALPLAPMFGGVSVKVTDSAGVDRLASIYAVYATASQVNLIIPSETAAGPAELTVATPGGFTLQSNVDITATAPALYTANMNGQGVYAGQVVHVHEDNTQTVDSSAVFNSTQNTFIANPVNLGPDTDQVFLVLYGTGIRHYKSDPGVTATVNGLRANLQVAAQPTYPGLDQINIELPRGLAGAGTVNIVVTVDGQAANTVTVTVQ